MTDPEHAIQDLTSATRDLRASGLGVELQQRLLNAAAHLLRCLKRRMAVADAAGEDLPYEVDRLLSHHAQWLDWRTLAGRILNAQELSQRLH